MHSKQDVQSHVVITVFVSIAFERHIFGYRTGQASFIWKAEWWRGSTKAVELNFQWGKAYACVLCHTTEQQRLEVTILLEKERGLAQCCLNCMREQSGLDLLCSSNSTKSLFSLYSCILLGILHGNGSLCQTWLLTTASQCIDSRYSYLNETGYLC